MNSKQLRLVLISLLLVSIVVFMSVYLFGMSALKKKSTQVVDLKLQSRTIDAQSANLAIAKKEVQQYGYFKDVAKTVIPSDKDQAQAVIDLYNLADQSGIALQSVTFPTSTLGTGGSSTSTNTDAKSASKQAVLSQSKAVEGIPGLYSLLLTVNPDTTATVPLDKKATYPKLLDFLNRIEKNRRTAQVTQVTVQPQSTNSVNSSYINFSLTIKIFIKP